MSLPETHTTNGHHAPISLLREVTPDRGKAQAGARALLEALGVDLSAPDLENTPRRIAAMYEELLTPKAFLRERVATRHEFLSLIGTTKS